MNAVSINNLIPLGAAAPAAKGSSTPKSNDDSFSKKLDNVSDTSNDKDSADDTSVDDPDSKEPMSQANKTVAKPTDSKKNKTASPPVGEGNPNVQEPEQNSVELFSILIQSEIPVVTTPIEATSNPAIPNEDAIVVELPDRVETIVATVDQSNVIETQISQQIAIEETSEAQFVTQEGLPVTTENVVETSAEPISVVAANLEKPETSTAEIATTPETLTDQSMVADISAQTSNPESESDLPSQLADQPPEETATVEPNVTNESPNFEVESQTETTGEVMDATESVIPREPVDVDIIKMAEGFGNNLVEEVVPTTESVASPMRAVSPAELSRMSAGNQVVLSLKSQMTDTNKPLQKLSVQLHPAELGQLQITIEHTAEKVSAQIVASESASVELLMQEKDFLLETLAELGLGDASLDVFQGEQQTDDDFEGNEQQFRGRFGSLEQVTDSSSNPLSNEPPASGLNLLV